MSEKKKIASAFDYDDWSAIVNSGATPPTYGPADAQGDPNELARTIAHANHLLPDSDPRKLTRQDVELLASVSARLACEWMGDGRHPFDEQLGELADRLAAILPPFPAPSQMPAHKRINISDTETRDPRIAR